MIARSVDVGQTVAASLSAPTLFLIAQDLTKMQVDTSVAEADVGKLKPGMTATFTVDAYPSVSALQGRDRADSTPPQTVQNVVTYDAVIDVENPELKLKPGMTANATVVHAERAGAVVVPNAALRFKPPAELTEKLDAGAPALGSGAPAGSAPGPDTAVGVGPAPGVAPAAAGEGGGVGAAWAGAASAARPIAAPSGCCAASCPPRCG